MSDEAPCAERQGDALQAQDAPSDWEPQPVGLTRHEAAVRRTLAWADEAAALLDYHGALQWLAAIEAIGDPLPLEYLGKQHAWAIAARQATQQ